MAYVYIYTPWVLSPETLIKEPKPQPRLHQTLLLPLLSLSSVTLPADAAAVPLAGEPKKSKKGSPIMVLVEEGSNSRPGIAPKLI